MQSRALLVFLLALTLLAGEVQASKSLDLVLDLAKSKAYRSREVDWQTVESQARAVERDQGEAASIRAVVSALGDRHTSYIPVIPANAAPRSLPAASSAPHSIAEVVESIGTASALRINGWSGNEPVKAVAIVREALNEALVDMPCGLILDFSGNGGGNMWPALIGLRPLLSEGKLGGFRHADEAVDQIEHQSGLIKVGGKPHFLNYPLYGSTVKPPKFIAIVIGPESASSGEITPLMFFGQSNVRFFGRQSAGFTSANQVFSLPNGAALVLTTAMTEDRNGRPHPDGIEPDTVSDEPFQDAAQWLGRECAR